MEITVKINGREVKASFVRSEEAGYRPGKLLLDLPSGDHISVYRVGRTWIEAFVSGQICRRSVEHDTRKAALNSAAEEYAAAVVDSEAFTA